MSKRIPKRRGGGGILRNVCTGSHDKILIWTFSKTRFQLIKHYANHMQSPHSACIYPPGLSFFPPLPGMWPLGNPSRNNRALIALLARCSGWNIYRSGDDTFEGSFWSAFGTWVQQSNPLVSYDGSIKSEPQEEFVNKYFLSVSWKVLSPVRGRLWPPCFFENEHTHT